MDPARLMSIPAFAALGEAACAAVAQFALEVSVPEDKDLVREGDYSYELMAIESGTAVVHRGEQQIATLGPGDIVGEMGVIDRELRTATVTSTSPMMLVALDRWDVKRLAKIAPDLLRELGRLAAERGAST